MIMIRLVGLYIGMFPSPKFRSKLARFLFLYSAAKTFSYALALPLALLLTRLATGRLMWWSGIQLSSYSLSVPVAAPADSFPESGSTTSTFLPFLTGALVLRACGKRVSIQVL